MSKSFKVIGREIRRFRHDIGITQSQLSEECGIGRPYLSAIERGANMPSDFLFGIIIEAMAKFRKKKGCKI